MRITELLKKESIELGVKVSGKEEAIDKLIGLMAAIKKAFWPARRWEALR